MKKSTENIFRPNDIRGVYGKDLTEEVAEKIGKAFGTILGMGKSVVVGRDVRLSSKSLRDSLVEGLTSVGCDVVDIGMVPTPTFYFSLYSFGFDGGIMITASHNPPEWNGFHVYEKMESITVGEKIEEMKKIISEEKFAKAKAEGKISKLDILKEYINFLSSNFEIRGKFKIVVDCSNGCAAILIKKLLKKLGQKVFLLNHKIDGNFPAHGPEVKEENSARLKGEIKRVGADLGVGYDGDADRVIFFDEKSRMLHGDRAALLFLEDLFERKRNPRILNEVSCSSAIEEYIKRRGGLLKTSRRGHAFIQILMRKEDMDFGFESSSHFYFKELKGFDDAFFATLKACEIIHKTGKKFSEIVDVVPWYPRKEKAVKCKDEFKLKVVENVKKEIVKEKLKFDGKDGVKVFLKDGWFLIRASITEPLIRISAEAKDGKKLEKIFKFAENLLKRGMYKYKLEQK
ncbi:MAG: phosphomannomutase/phosphoglucomutase [Candidatus Aenigmatarchaeota archaeon]